VLTEKPFRKTKNMVSHHKEEDTGLSSG